MRRQVVQKGTVLDDLRAPSVRRYMDGGSVSGSGRPSDTVGQRFCSDRLAVNPTGRDAVRDSCATVLALLRRFSAVYSVVRDSGAP